MPVNAAPCVRGLPKEIVMRADMSKVIVERPRRRFPLKNGSAYPRGSLENRWGPELEDAPRLESMGGIYGDKWLNENLQPLVRFLRSQVGRPWNKVHAEIAERISGRSAVQKHVLDHLRDYVSEHVEIVGKEIWSFQSRFDVRRPLHSRGNFSKFYVHPRSGILKRAPDAPRKITKPDPDRRTLTNDREHRRIDGIWYELILHRIPNAAEARSHCFDVVEKTSLVGAVYETHAWTNALWRTGRYAACKVQLGKRELARHGLR